MSLLHQPFSEETTHKAARLLWDEQRTYYVPLGRPITFSIDTPPPTVSGKLHIGHIFSYTHTDITARFHRMMGESVFYPFGFDDNGLPTERYVEKTYEISALATPRAEFKERCLAATADAVKDFTHLWKRMGLSVDWSKVYSTISSDVQEIAQRSFLALYKKGYIYRRNEPALYCTAFRTSVSQADLEDVEVETFFSDIPFTDAQGKEYCIGTTRPELLAACVAILYHPTDDRYSHLAGKTLFSPLYKKEVPVLADEDVDPEKGTGLVMCCTFGDKTDIVWFKRHNLPYIAAIGRDGKMTEVTDFLLGLSVKQAREAILKRLQEENLIRAQRTIKHAVSVYERSKREIEYVMLPQWFVSVVKHKQELIAIADTIEWHPEYMKARYVDWVRNLEWDWCISRQRPFGVPFPVWHGENGEVYLPDESLLPLDPTTQACPGHPTAKGDTDVMDTWNISSLTPYICASLVGYETQSLFHQDAISFLPMSMRPQAHDIIRTWAFYTIIKSWMHHGVIPWKQIVISGHVLSKDSGKISKSKGNSIYEPEVLLSTYPADAIRYWTASARLGTDVAFSEGQMKIGQRLLVKLWNAAKFVVQFDAPFKPEPVQKPQYGLNQYILHRATSMWQSYRRQQHNHEASLALATIEQFFWSDFCDNYLEYVKPILFNPGQFDDTVVHETRHTLTHLFMRILQCYAPFIPHVTETIYQELSGGSLSLHSTQFSDIQYEYSYGEMALIGDDFSKIVDVVRKKKTEHQLSLKAPVGLLRVIASRSHKGALQDFIPLLKRLLSAEEIIIYDVAPEQIMPAENNGLINVEVNLTLKE